MKYSEPYTEVFIHNGRTVTSIVVDKGEFDENVDALIDVLDMAGGGRTGTEQVKLLKECNFMPLCTKGTKTQFLFDKYAIETDALAMIVRGKGLDVFRQLMAE
jgi:hypothetical protein